MVVVTLAVVVVVARAVVVVVGLAVVLPTAGALVVVVDGAAVVVEVGASVVVVALAVVLVGAAVVVVVTSPLCFLASSFPPLEPLIATNTTTTGAAMRAQRGQPRCIRNMRAANAFISAPRSMRTQSSGWTYRTNRGGGVTTRSQIRVAQNLRSTSRHLLVVVTALARVSGRDARLRQASLLTGSPLEGGVRPPDATGGMGCCY